MKPKLFLFLAALLIGFLTRADAAQPRLPADVFRALDTPTEITLYSTNPDSRVFHWSFSRWFHGYRIIGKVSVLDPIQRRQVAAVVRRAAQTYIGDTKCVFSPRHAVRLSSGNKTYDFLICFQCLQMEVYSGDELVNKLSIGGSPDALNRILHAARIRIAP
jgi:hypothetical protein